MPRQYLLIGVDVMGRNDRRPGGEVATCEEVAQGGRSPNGDRVSGGDETSGNPGVEQQQNGKQCVQQTFDDFGLTWVHLPALKNYSKEDPP